MNYSIIIPVSKKDTRFLKRCLLSILDQDCQDWEAIVVFDGFKHKLPVDDNRIKSIELPEKKGASFSRNTGYAESSNELLFFFDSDCELYPGMLTLMRDHLINDSNDFVYGGYRFNNDTLNTYPSRPFDPYILESFNYICTMSPMKRHVYESISGFNNDLKYFQDWDFWLRAVKAGHKGHYIKDMIFSTEVPNRTSISGSTEYSLKDKLLKIENLNNIPNRDICITTLSCPYQAVERAKALNARYIGAHQDSTLIQLPSQFDLGYKAVIMQGLFPVSIQDHMGAFPENSLKIANFIGTDVWQLRNKFSFESLKILKDVHLSKLDKILCNSEFLQSELSDIGIDAEVVYQPMQDNIQATSLPEKPKVSAYFSKGHPMHNEDLLLDIANALPDIDFLFFGTNLKNHTQDNITFKSFMNIQDAINESTIHIRVTNHDGFPHTPVQFLMAGRKVLCNFDLKYADKLDGIPNANNWELMKSTIVEYIRSNISTSELLDYKQIQDHYLTLCSKQTYKIKMEKIIASLIKGKEVASEPIKSNLCVANIQ